ncbi:phosphatase PAP2 family protein [Zhouia sp. PK063]|uniref:phosphatase PAP2 family protein n=1 Tax=Zhouia sp. PK063 TaxID=3373602 RepID=UPI0037A8C165
MIKKLHYLLITGFIIFSIANSFAQKYNRLPQNATTWQMFTYDMGNVFGGMGYAYSRPFYWQKDDFVTFGALAGSASLLYIVDDKTSDFFRKQKRDVPEWLLDYGWYYGSPQNNYALSGLVYLTGLFSKNEKLRRTGVLLISSASAAGFLQQVTQKLAGRARPRTNKGKNFFQPFSDGSDYRSFPSGHTVLSFTNAYAIAKQFRNPWVKAGIYAVGLVPPVTRLWEGAHFLTDIVLSVGLSIATVEAVDAYLDYKYEQKYNDNSQKQKKLSWNLQFGLGQVGITGTF